MSYILPYKDKTPKIDTSVYVSEGVVVTGDVRIGTESNIWFGVVIRGDTGKIFVGIESKSSMTAQGFIVLQQVKSGHLRIQRLGQILTNDSPQ